MLLYNYILYICNFIPAIIVIASLTIGLIFKNINAIIFCILTLGCSIINVILKSYIFKPLYYGYGNKTLPLLGKGDRPRGHPKLDLIENYYKNSISFGMPSGHSQIMGFFSTFWIIYILYKKKLSSQMSSQMSISDIGSIFYLTIIALLVMYSRYK